MKRRRRRRSMTRRAGNEERKGRNGGEGTKTAQMEGRGRAKIGEERKGMEGGGRSGGRKEYT